jgi:hypothetical protein
VDAWEQRLRTELRSEAELITPDSLRALSLRGQAGPASVRPLPTGALASERPRRHEWLAPAAAAVAVAVIAAAIGIVSGHTSPAGQETAGGSRMPIVGDLAGVAALSARDVWAVGSVDVRRTRHGHRNMTFEPLIVHWDGTNWRRVAAPTEPSGGWLASVAGTSPDNVWAVGMWLPGQHPHEPMIMHWNGKKWQLERFADATKIGQLIGVTVLSASDAWAVGELGNAGPDVLILHWNGISWNQVPAPALGPAPYLQSVAAVSAGDAWAVGSNNRGVLILHWNGSSWTRQTAPKLPRSQAWLASVATDSAHDVWAVGSTFDVPAAIIMHRTGAAWQVMPGPIPEVENNLLAVAVVSPHNVWAVGGGNYPNTVILHWNGTSWSQSKDSAAVFKGTLYGLAAISADNIWAVGVLNDCGAIPGLPQILHWNGTSWKTAYGPATTGGGCTTVPAADRTPAAPANAHRPRSAARPAPAPHVQGTKLRHRRH